MRTVLFILMTLQSTLVLAQSHYDFVYDASGNRVAKELVGNAPIPSITGDTLACVGQNKVFTVTQASVSAYQWDNGATTQSLNFMADSSRYRKVTVTYTNGCKKHRASVGAGGQSFHWQFGRQSHRQPQSNSQLHAE